MKTKNTKKSGANPVKDLHFILEKHKRAIEKLNVIVAQKEQYLEQRSSLLIKKQLEALYTAIVDIAEGMKMYVMAYNELVSAYTLSNFEANALCYALPEDRSDLSLGRELYALRYQIKHKRMPERRLSDRVREKVDRFEKRISKEENAVQHG